MSIVGMVVRPKAAAVFAAAALLAAAALPRAADAFCGFYVSPTDGKLVADATQVVLMREGTRTVITMPW